MPEGDAAQTPRPRLVGVPGGAAERPGHEARPADRVGRPGWLLALLALLLLLSVATLVAQARRVEKLAAEVAALELQVDAANRRLAAYEAQRDFVRDSLGSVLEQLEAAHEILSEDPLAPSEPAEVP